MAAGGFRLGQRAAGVFFVKKHLALQIGGLDEIAVDEGECSDSGAREQGSGCCSGGTASDDSDVRGGEHVLAGRADSGEEYLTGVAVV